jgi:hypothetical protein
VLVLPLNLNVVQLSSLHLQLTTSLTFLGAGECFALYWSLAVNMTDAVTILSSTTALGH